MTEFRARIRKPKPRTFKGCVVTEVTQHVSPVRGTPYAKIYFVGSRFPAIYGLLDAELIRRALEERGLYTSNMAPDVGEAVDIELRWTYWPERRCWAPSLSLDRMSFVDLRTSTLEEEQIQSDGWTTYLMRKMGLI